MLVWDNGSHGLSPEHSSHLEKEIERVGKDVEVKPWGEPNRFFVGHKVWEYPVTYKWLMDLIKHSDKKQLRIMDFGCGWSTYPEALAQEGHEVWAVDNDKWKLLKKSNCQKYLTTTNYFVGEIEDIPVDNFDVILSHSVLEHVKAKRRNEIVNAFCKLLALTGKQLHIIDYFLPEHNHFKNNIDFYVMGQKCGFEIDDMKYCPGSPEYNFESIRQETYVRFYNRETRIAFGHDSH